FEINEAAALVAQAAHAEANIIFGATIDDALGDEVRVTVIAAGFDGGMPKRRDNGTVLRREPAPQQTQSETRAAAQQPTSNAGLAMQGGVSQERPAQAEPSTTSSQPAPASGQEERPASRPQPSQPLQPTQPAQPVRQPRQVQFDDDELDVPDFLK
ncbi:MAG: cell division protein FtsZ, partial [Nocardioidaceae bacterium]